MAQAVYRHAAVRGFAKGGGVERQGEHERERERQGAGLKAGRVGTQCAWMRETTLGEGKGRAGSNVDARSGERRCHLLMPQPLPHTAEGKGLWLRQEHRHPPQQQQQQQKEEEEGDLEWQRQAQEQDGARSSHEVVYSGVAWTAGISERPALACECACAHVRALAAAGE